MLQLERDIFEAAGCEFNVLNERQAEDILCDRCGCEKRRPGESFTGWLKRLNEQAAAKIQAVGYMLRMYTAGD